MKTQKIKKRFVLLCVLAVLLALIIWTAWGNTALMVNTISDRLSKKSAEGQTFSYI